MKNILLSVDFSKNAQKVALLTAQMAQLSKARLVLFHAYCPVEITAGDPEVEVNTERRVQTRLDKLARVLHKETGVSITRLMKPATTQNEALEVAKIVKADIAVVCDETMNANTTVSVTRYQNLLVLAVPAQLYFNLIDFQASLAEQLRLLGYSSPPLLETV